MHRKQRTFSHWTQPQLDYLHTWYGKKTAKQIALDIKRKPSSIIHKAGQLKLKSDLSRILTEDIIKERLLTANIKMTGLYNGYNKKTKFICPFCNNEFLTSPCKIISGHTKSCGCVAVGKRRGTKYISSTYFSSVKQGAEYRDLEFSISIDYISKLLEKQNFKCALSKLDLVYGYVSLKEYTASLDRIDSSKGYTKKNIQWVHKDINMMKQDYSQKYFIELCTRIGKTNAS